MSRLIALAFALGLVVPVAGAAGTAEAQVWKVKKNKGAKPAKKAGARGKPTVRKKRAVRPKKQAPPPPVDDDEVDDDEVDDDGDGRGGRASLAARDRDAEPEEALEPIVIRVEEID